MIQTVFDRMSQQPALWGFLRRIAENGFRAERELIASELAPRAGLLYLDFGCGTGESAGSFPPGSYTGFDLASYYVRYAAAHRSGRYSVMDGATLGFADSRFDGALVVGVFHHLSDDVVRRSVAELHRTLRPGARLLVMEDIPSPRPWNLLGHLMHWADRGDYIRSDDDYRALLQPYFQIARSTKVKSGICDLAVYVLERADTLDIPSARLIQRAGER